MNALLSNKPPNLGIDCIRECEGCRLEAYQDQAGIWTIGWGHTLGVYRGMTCSQKQADDWLANDVEADWQIIRKYVKVPLEPHQAGALLSFLYNVGIDHFCKSTLLHNLNAGSYASVPLELAKWTKTTVNGEKVDSQGLIKRREIEASLWKGV